MNMKKITILMLFLISFVQIYGQNCTNGDCSDINVNQSQSWSPSHGSPTWGSNSVTIWSYNNRGEGVNYFGYNFIAGEEYCVSFTLNATTQSTAAQNANCSMNVILTQNQVIGNVTPPGNGGAIPNTPNPNQQIMDENIWNTSQNVQTHQFTFRANQNYNNLWFHPSKPNFTQQVNVTISNVKICHIACDPNEGVAFHFENEDGDKKDRFNLCDNVYLSAFQTQGDNMTVELSKVNFNGTTTELSTRSTSSKYFDLTSFFAVNLPNPVVFEENTTYEVKVSIDHDRCGRTFDTKRFTYNSKSMSPDFTLNYQCKEDAFDTTVIATDKEPNHSWKLYETRVKGSTSDADTFRLVSEVTGTTAHTFKDLDLSKYFYVKHTVWTTNCSEEEQRIALEPGCCRDNEGVAFNFENEDGDNKTLFNICDDVYLSAHSTIAVDNYKLEISRVNSDNSLTLLSQKDTDKRYLNLTSLFANDAINPVVFEEGAYELKLSIQHPNCGLTYDTKRFTYRAGTISSEFTLSYNCHDAIYDATAIAVDKDSNHNWKLFETSIVGSTSDANTIGLIAENSGSTAYVFENLDPSKHYYIAHIVSTTNCSADESRIALTPDCCPEEPQIFPYCEDPCVLDSFPLKVKGSDGNIITLLDGYTFEWINARTGESSNNDIVIATEADLWSLTLKMPDYNCEYQLDYTLTCCDEGIEIKAYECPSSEDLGALQAQIQKLNKGNQDKEYQKHLMYLNTLRKSDNLETSCNPCTDELFIIKVIDNEGNLITDFESIIWNDGLYKNQNIRWGNINTEYKATIVTKSANGLSTCTHEDTIIYKCDIIKECDNLPAPTNLKYDRTTLSWDPVPGAKSYIVRPSSGSTTCCRELLIFNPIETTTNSVAIPIELQKGCFAWEVVAVCSDGSTSEASEASCYRGLIDIGCNLPAPKNLRSFGNTLMWDAVPGAKGYYVRQSFRGSTSCCSSDVRVFSPLLTPRNYIDVGGGIQRSCFLWEVVAICSDDSFSTPSSPACYRPLIGIGGLGLDGDTRKIENEISVFPNPNNGTMNIKLEDNMDLDVTLDIFRLNGSKVKSIKNVNLNSKSKSGFNFKSDLPKGIYLFNFNTKKGVISKRIIIE